MLNPTPIQTEDGSYSLQHSVTGETYHSKHGALQESVHVFLNEGFKHRLEKEPSLTSIKILEIGFGTGLNALISIVEALNQKIDLTFDSLELHPIDPSIVHQLSYKELLQLDDDIYLLYKELHESNYVKTELKSSHISVRVIIQDLLLYQLPLDYYDVIYFDAFAPTSQPDLWSDDVFRRMYDTLKTGGILTTYCAKGSVKRSIKKAGFTLDSIPGPPGKREMSRAIKL